MSPIDQTLAAIREAIRLTPGNVPLMQHYVRTLNDLSRYDEAETFLKEVLPDTNNSAAVQLMLAEVFQRQNKHSHAMAILDTLIDPKSPYPPALVLYAKTLYREGKVDRAVSTYKLAVEHDEEVADPQFAEQLGIRLHDLVDDDQEEIVDGKVRFVRDAAPEEPNVGQIEKPQTKFADVGGMEAVKDQIRVKIIYPLQHADMYAAYGQKIGGGILMYGPPGCGKTHLARATAGEIDSNFQSIGLNHVLDMWMGNSERNLHQIFEHARRNRPCVLFFDEVDGLGASRNDMRHSGMRQTINQFLSEMDGIQASNEGLLILGATNAPWHIDSAFRRPGRFDRVLFIPPPDAIAREEILAIMLQGKPAGDVDRKKIAARTEDFSGADLKSLVSNAVESKLQEAIKSGRITPLTTNDLLASLKVIKPTTKEWFATARNHALYANQGGTYDDVLEYMKLK